MSHRLNSKRGRPSYSSDNTLQHGVVNDIQDYFEISKSGIMPGFATWRHFLIAGMRGQRAAGVTLAALMRRFGIGKTAVYRYLNAADPYPEAAAAD